MLIMPFFRWYNYEQFFILVFYTLITIDTYCLLKSIQMSKNTRMHKIQIMQKCVKFKKSTLVFPYSLTITSTNLIIS